MSESKRGSNNRTPFLYSHTKYKNLFDEQLIATVQMASTDSNAALVHEIQERKALMASQEPTTTLKGSEIDVEGRRTYCQKNKRGK